MRRGLDRREVESLAKTMEVKFSVSGPAIGGAKSGIDFDPTDPEDTNLLRFDVHRFDDGNWVAVDDASYCTLMPAKTPEPILQKGLEIIMDRIAANPSIKKACEDLSYIDPDLFGL